MFKFENPEMLYALVFIPLAIMLYIFLTLRKRKALRKFGESFLISKLSPEVSWIRHHFKFSLLLLAWILLVLAIANPQIGSKLVKSHRKGVDLMICLDVSNSMLTEDIAPNRLESAKRAISKLIDNLQGDRVGIVVFAGKGYIQLPLTNDYAASKMFLSTINPSLIPTQGTAIAHAINLASGTFKDDRHSKAIIIITDGEDHEGNALAEAEAATANGIRIFTIGIGSPEGSPIPDFNAAGQKTGFKKDNEGKTVVSSLNETILQQIASAGNGVYVRSASTQASLKKVLEEIDSMEKQEYDTRIFSDYEDRFYYFLWPALILLIAELFLAARKSKWISNIRLFENKSKKAKHE